MVNVEEHEAVRASAGRRRECSHCNTCDGELVMVGGFSPLLGFMHHEDYGAVVAGYRTTSGLLFGLPIVFDTDQEDGAVGQKLLPNNQGRGLAVLRWRAAGSPTKWRRRKAAMAPNLWSTRR